MVSFGPREITMLKGWVVEYTDGTVLCEDDMSWPKLPKDKKIKRVILKWNDRFWQIEGKEHYTLPTTRGFIDVRGGQVGGQGVDSRTIGYYDLQSKCKVLLRVNEATGKMSYEQEPL